MAVLDIQGLHIPLEMDVVRMAVADVQHLAAGAVERWAEEGRVEEEERDMGECAEAMGRLGLMAKDAERDGRLQQALYLSCETASLYRRVSDLDPEHDIVAQCRPIYQDMTSTMVNLKRKMADGETDAFCPCSICKRKSLPPQDGPSVLMPPSLHPITTLDSPPQPVSHSPLTPEQRAYYRSSLAAADLALTKRISAFAQANSLINAALLPPPTQQQQPGIMTATTPNDADKGKESLVCKTDASSSAVLAVDAARRRSALVISRAREVIFADKTATSPEPSSDATVTATITAPQREKRSQVLDFDHFLSAPRPSYSPSPYHLRSDSDSLLTCPPSHSSLSRFGSPSPDPSRVHFHTSPSPDASASHVHFHTHFHTHSEQSSGVGLGLGPDASQLSIVPPHHPHHHHHHPQLQQLQQQQQQQPIFLRSSLPTGASPSFSRDTSQSFGHSTSQSFTLRSTDMRSSETGFNIRPSSDGIAFNLRGGGPVHGQENAFALIRSESPESSLGRSSSSGPLPSSFHCQICLELEPMEYVSTVDGCEHQFGKDCLRSYIVSRLSEGRFPIPCPTCAVDAERGGAIAAAGGIQNPPAGGRARGGIISSSQATRVGLTDAEYAHWNELALAQFQIQFHCESCSQTLTLDRDKFIKLKKSKKIACPTPGCGQVWCKECQKTVEKGSKKKHVCEGKAELKRLVRQEGWRLCPGCNIPIHKKEGCNHITCSAPGCNTHFCYRCGKILVRSVFGTDVYEATHAHFRRRLYFWRCSQYQGPGFLTRLFTGRRVF